MRYRRVATVKSRSRRSALTYFVCVFAISFYTPESCAPYTVVVLILYRPTEHGKD